MQPPGPWSRRASMAFSRPGLEMLHWHGLDHSIIAAHPTALFVDVGDVVPIVRCWSNVYNDSL
eukprot:269096-Amphidinium_carterae.2